MVDFAQLRRSKKQPPPIDPIEIFRRLPKSPRINDLYVSQANVLNEWFEKRTKAHDFVIKLHTGGGKTLVGLLIAQSIINETNEPVLYLASTKQLVNQTLKQADEYNISAIGYDNTKHIDELLSPQHVLVATYQALFNGRSRFGVRDTGTRQIATAGGIVLDDAHTAFSTIRDVFTLKLSRQEHEEDYRHIVTLFKPAFEETGRQGYFEDIVLRSQPGILEIPHWHWIELCDEVRQFLGDRLADEAFEWPLLRDAFRYSHCLINSRAIVVTPFLPMVDLFPTYSECPKRVFMSATIPNDSDMIRTFGIEKAVVENAIRTESLAGVSERMILIPQLTDAVRIEWPSIIRQIAKSAAEKGNIGTVALVPSFKAAEEWEESGIVAQSGDVQNCVEALQTQTKKGPFVFANRYDGIDLPNDACRLLILDGLPKGISEYDEYRLYIFEQGRSFSTTLAQRIEQGIGRAARGAGDYCVVILSGRELIPWLGRENNLRLLTESTKAQIEIGMEVSRHISNPKQLVETMNSCIGRDPEWIRFHAETLADLTEEATDISLDLNLASLERRIFRLLRERQYKTVVIGTQEFIEENTDLDKHTQGWLLQTAARAAVLDGQRTLSENLQKEAFYRNKNLFRSPISMTYETVTFPGDQSAAIASFLNKFRYRRAALGELEKLRTLLSPASSSAQFEQALESLGEMLGFTTERPEQIYGKGPDVLWILDQNQALIIEVKSQKKPENPLTKGEHGQLLTSLEWFETQYPQLRGIPVCVHPNDLATESATVNQAQVLTLSQLNELLRDFSSLLQELTSIAIPESELPRRCEQLIERFHLTPINLQNHFLQSFRVVE